MSWLKTFANKSLIHWLLAAVILFAAAFMYMGPALTHCSQTSTALFSDSSGGMAWDQWASGNGLSWGYTHETNYPIGEQLERPQYITSEALYIPYRLLSHMTTPICGLNLIVLTGYMSVGLVMFGLVRWLFGRTSIALLAGYAAAFVPYHQIKSEAHVIYVNSAIFIGIIWAYLWFAQRPSYKRISLLAILAAWAMYMDGYYILLSGILVSTLLIIGLFKPNAEKRAVSFWRFLGASLKQNIAQLWRQYVWLGAIVLVLTAPIIDSQLRHGSEIKQSLTEARETIQVDALAYGARPAEYLLPPFDSWFMPTGYGHWRLVHQHGSNPTEDTLYVGLTIALLALISVLALSRRETRRIEIKKGLSYAFVVSLLALTAIAGFLLSLPPRLTIWKYGVTMPTDLFIKITSFWRVFARLFLIIDPLLIVLAASALFLASRNLSRLKFWLLIVICSGLVFAEYLSSPLRFTSNLSSASPPTYQSLAKDQSVKVVAEYPMTQLGYSPFTFTFQQLYKKPLINPNDVKTVQGPFIQAIAGLNDPQTVGALKAAGADLIISAGNPAEGAGLTVYQPPDDSGASMGIPTIYSYRISSSALSLPVVLAPESGFDQATIDSRLISHHVIHGPAVLEVLTTTTESRPSGSYQISFDTASLSGKPEQLNLSQGGKVIWRGSIPVQTTHVSVPVNGQDPVNLSPSSSLDVSAMQAAPL